MGEYGERFSTCRFFVMVDRVEFQSVVKLPSDTFTYLCYDSKNNEEGIWNFREGEYFVSSSGSNCFGVYGVMHELSKVYDGEYIGFVWPNFYLNLLDEPATSYDGRYYFNGEATLKADEDIKFSECFGSMGYNFSDIDNTFSKLGIDMIASLPISSDVSNHYSPREMLVMYGGHMADYVLDGLVVDIFEGEEYLLVDEWKEFIDSSYDDFVMLGELKVMKLSTFKEYINFVFSVLKGVYDVGLDEFKWDNFKLDNGNSCSFFEALGEILTAFYCYYAIGILDDESSIGKLALGQSIMYEEDGDYPIKPPSEVGPRSQYSIELEHKYPSYCKNKVLPVMTLFHEGKKDMVFCTSYDGVEAYILQGYRFESCLGHVCSDFSMGKTPIYELFLPYANDHLYTISKEECEAAQKNDGYLLRGILGYLIEENYLSDGKNNYVIEPRLIFRFWNANTTSHYYNLNDKKVVRDGYVLEGGCFRLVNLNLCD